MAHEDRDRDLQKALVRHFHSSSAQGAEPIAAGVSSPSCPDAEMLAAYHDGTLAAEERNLWKQHVLSCENCQLVLAHLATPLDVAAPNEAHELLFAAAAAQPRPSPEAASSLTPAASRAAVSIARPRKIYFRWLVPAGALAAGLLTWVVLRESQSIPKVENPAVETAENRSPEPALRDAKTPSSAPVEAKKAETNALRADIPRLKDSEAKRDEGNEKDQATSPSAGGVLGGARGRSAVAAKESPSQVQLTQQAPNLSSADAAGGPAVSLQQQQRQQTTRMAAPPSPASPAPKPEERSSFISEDSVAPPAQKAVPAAAPQPAAASANAVTGSPQAFEAAGAPPALAKVRSAVMQSPQTFGAPGGKFLWRVGTAGSVEHSTDGGATWKVQESGITADLLTGFAPTPKICWVVGSSGTILRTTDGGEHWLTIPSPVQADLLSVRASDALRASIWYVADQPRGLLQSYRTSDGGATWSLDSKQ